MITFFLPLHFIKHFVKYGANLRNLLDIVLFYRYYSQMCDCSKFWDEMKKLRFDNLIRAIICVGVNFCSIAPVDFLGVEALDKSIALRVLSDIEDGGWMEQKENEERDRIRLVYEKALYDRTSTNGNLVCIWTKRARVMQLLKAFFALKNICTINIRMCKKSVYLLPIA